MVCNIFPNISHGGPVSRSLAWAVYVCSQLLSIITFSVKVANAKRGRGGEYVETSGREGRWLEAEESSHRTPPFFCVGHPFLKR